MEMGAVHVYAGAWPDFDEGVRKLVQVNDLEVGVFAHEGVLYAYENRCIHQGGPVCEGVVLGRVEAVLDEERKSRGERFSETRIHLICPWHGWEYDLRDGRSATDPSVRLRKFEVVREGDEVYVVA
jgi:nitrite reductase (NADH) small subunit